MPRVGNNPNWNRFNLIMKKVIGGFNLQSLTQSELIARCYDWYEPFAEIWEEQKFNESYTSWLIYRGIGSIHSSGGDIKGIDDVYGLLNDDENRKKASKKIMENFSGELTETQFIDVNSRLVKYLTSDNKDGFISEYSRRVSDSDQKSVAKYIRSYLVPALESIEDAYEKFAGIIIYAQSGCIPLDVVKAESKKSEENPVDGVNAIYNSSSYRELTDPFFLGKFYGFFRQYHSESGVDAYKGLIPFELTIENGDKGTNATMKFKRFVPSRPPAEVLMTGKPVIGQQIIHVVFQADKGDDFITMSYKWRSLKNGPLQARQGVMITMARHEESPQVQRFIFFNQPIFKEYEKYVDAFLRFSGDRFMVSDQAVKKLPTETVEFLKKYGNPFSGYMISSTQAISGGQYDNISDNEIIKELLEIKRYSPSPLVINAEEGKQVSDFFRSLLGANQENSYQ